MEWVKLDEEAAMYPMYGADVVDVDHPWRHDSNKLADRLMDLLFERTGPLSMGE